MPELPEVETIVTELKQCIVGKTIDVIEELRCNTVVQDQNTVSEKLGTICTVSRRGKYIVISTDKAFILLIHLRMTGKLIYAGKDQALAKHTRAVVRFTDGTLLMFDDARTFGVIKVIRNGDTQDTLGNLGSEPLSDEFDKHTMKQLLTRKRTTIKNFLLDQRFIAGLGNIYVNEILYACRIPPKKLTTEITDNEAGLLVKKTRQILRMAIKQNGTSISDYRRVDNKTGSFQNFLKIYGKEKCREGHNVLRTKSGGRSTFHCPHCQKENT